MSNQHIHQDPNPSSGYPPGVYPSAELPSEHRFQGYFTDDYTLLHDHYHEDFGCFSFLRGCLAALCFCCVLEECCCCCS